MSTPRKRNYTLVLALVLLVYAPGTWFLNHDKALAISCAVLGVLLAIPGIVIERRNKRTRD